MKPIDRGQGFPRPVIVDELVPPGHKARAIWDLGGQLDLNGFTKEIKSKQGQAGRAAWDPRLPLSVCVYAYSEQVTSASEIERLMECEPGLMWLAGLGEVNYHTLSREAATRAGIKRPRMWPEVTRSRFPAGLTPPRWESLKTWGTGSV